jgi:hypothetical protein
MISLFENINYFLVEFPASEKVSSQLQKLDKIQNSKEYFSVLKSVLSDKNVIEYLKVIKQASV